MGDFKRKLLNGLPLHFDSGRAFTEGRGSSGRVLVTPTLPFTLAAMRPQSVISDGFSSWTISSILMGFETTIFWEGTRHTERNIKPWKHNIRRWLASKAKSFVVNGEFAKEYLVRELDVEERKVWLGGMCPMLPPKGTELSVSEPAERVKFLFCGQLNKRKGAEHLIKAAALLKGFSGLERSFEVNIIGEGEDSQALQTLVDSLEISDQVKLLGFVNPADIWNRYRENHVFVLPTLHDNWPLVIPEAMSMGMPVLLSQYAGSYPDLIVEGENGYVFDPNDEEKLAHLMSLYVNNVSRVTKHGQKSLDVVKPYNFENAAHVALEALGAV
ncbi:MAG: glycosyltransferase family 4 protein [Cyanobacteria bacterium J06581_3]